MIKKDLIEKEMANADDFVQLEKKLTTIEEWQLNQWKVELAYLIEIETIRRLKNKRIFYKQVIKNDPLVKKAVDVFVSEYNQILQTK